MSTLAYAAATCNLLEELIQEIKALNRTQESVLSAIANLTNRLQTLDLETARSSSQASAVIPNMLTNYSDQLSRKHGYVNWNSTHETLKTQQWKDASDITIYCGYKSNGVYNEGFNVYSFNIVDEKTRFPQNHLYVNISNPQIAAEILYIKQKMYSKDEVIKRNCSGELVEHFLNSAKIDMHTRSSFEQKYGLIWVEPE